MEANGRAITFPEFIRFRAENGIRGAIIEASRKSRISAGEYLRHALRQKLESDGVPLPPLETSTSRTAA